MKNKILLMMIIIGSIALVTYFDESSGQKIQNFYKSNDNENKVQLIPYLEYRFQKRKEIDGYFVETYREYEVFEDAQGNIVKTVPTSNYDYIRYKKY
ncbi:hypothetical protein P9265_06235 [Schinkia azotoformans]|uniref:hypothetical protein n=1 Tax=Schinkia azotoformans TaxID=1454 RepID=UPI002E1AC066|nr:hypothetical protein [Schinkia azotoformans]